MIHSIEIKKSARYYTQGNSDTASILLIALHGYGQLPQYFIRKFQSLDDKYYVIAPEGFHRFYLKGSAGRVGASWMTKEAREDDIQDNHLYLDALVKEHFSKKQFDKIIVLGFSQGGATAARWYYHTHLPVNQLILWASVFPPDIPLETLKIQSNSSDNLFVIGTEDEYYNGEKQSEIISEYEQLNFNIVTFAGRHDIDSETLLNILR